MKTVIAKKKFAAAIVFAALLCAVAIAVLCMPLFAKAEGGSSRSPADLWSVGNGVTVQANKDLPSRMVSGWENHGTGGYREVTADDLDENQKNGVLFTVTGENQTIEFANTIDLSGFTKDDTIIEIMPVSSNPVYSFDFSDLRVTLTDADDPTNWFTVHWSAGEIDNFDISNLFACVSSLLIETSTGVNTALQYGWVPGTPLDDTTWGSSIWHQWGFGFTQLYSPMHNSVYPSGDRGELQIADMRAMPCSFSFDVAKKHVWITKNDFTRLVALPIGEEEMTYVPAWTKDENGNVIRNTGTETVTETIMGYGKAFKGFKHNRAKLSIKVSGLQKESAQFYVTNVAGRGMNGDEIADDEMPSIHSPLDDEDLPIANVGMVYPFYEEVEFYDFYDGVLPYKVYVKEPNQSDFSAKPVSDYVPQKEGEYVFKYVSYDSSGNSNQKEYTVFAQYAANEIAINVTEPSGGYNVGQTVALPNATYSGGSGKLETEVTVTRLSDGKSISVENAAFVPVLSGEYAVTYSAVDFLGRGASKTVIVSVGNEKLPVYASELKMYKKLVSGERVKLPRLTAYDYSTLPGQKLSATTEIEIRGKDDFAGIKEISADGVFTPTVEKFGENIEIIYRTYCGNDKSGATERKFDAELIKPDYIWDYFIADDNTEIGYNADGEDNFVSFAAKTNGNASVEFANSLPADEFELQFGTTEENAEKFDSFKIVLKDYDDASKNYEFDIKNKDDKESLVSHDGESVSMSGAFGGNGILQLSIRDGRVLDYGGNVLFDLGRDAFPSGRLWVALELNDAVSGALMRLQKIGSQLLRASYRGGQLQKFSYTVSPSIRVADFDNSVLFGGTFTVPYAEAYDMFTSYVETFYSLVDPDGNVLASNKPVNGTDSYKFDKYGEYTLTFTAQNGNGRKRNIPHTLYVFDKAAPFIEYGGAEEISAKTGEEVKFEQVKVIDAVDENPEYYLFVEEKDLSYKNITATHGYTFTRAGVYKVKYIAFDASDNTSVKEITVTVK